MKLIKNVIAYVKRICTNVQREECKDCKWEIPCKCSNFEYCIKH